MQKVLKQVGVKSIAKKDELKIFGKGPINASKLKLSVPNLSHRICMSALFSNTYRGKNTN